jgi:hypothetical protein
VSALQLDDIQGIILRGYGSFAYVRHFIAAVADAGRARALIAGLAGPNLAGPGPAAVNPDKLAITTAAIWQVKPDYTLNVAFTYEGLSSLGVSSTLLVRARICRWSHRQRQCDLRCGCQRPCQLGRAHGDCIRGSLHLFTLRAHLA